MQVSRAENVFQIMYLVRVWCLSRLSRVIKNNIATYGNKWCCWIIAGRCRVAGVLPGCCRVTLGCRVAGARARDPSVKCVDLETCKNDENYLYVTHNMLLCSTVACCTQAVVQPVTGGV